MNSHKLLAYGPLPIRILAGITFLAHGLPKFENIAGTQDFFGSVGLPPELALPIGLLEVIGGIFLLIGVVTRIAAALFIIDDWRYIPCKITRRICRRIRIGVVVNSYIG